MFKVDDKGAFRTVYNGPGHTVWELVKDSKTSNGQRPVSLSVLEQLNEAVAQEDRIPRRLP